MIITIDEIKSVFDEYNKKAFNNELPLPMFELMETKSLLGQFRTRRIMGEKVYIIRISKYFDRAFEGYRNTIVHEMLHYYIRFKGIKDSSSHGYQWKKYAAQLNNKFPELKIQRCSDVQGGISNEVAEKKFRNKIGKFEYVAIGRFANGKMYACVLPKTKLSTFYYGLKDWTKVLSVKVVSAPWSETFDLTHLKTRISVRFITEETYNRLNKYKEIKL